VKLVFAGTPTAALPSLEALFNSDHEVAAIITQPPAPTGRGRKITPSAVEEFARTNDIPVFTPQSVSDVHSQLLHIKPDCIPIVAYGQLIPQDMLDLPPLGWVNLHFSLLPSWRGAAPVQHAIWAGDRITGATTFILDAGMDTGPVLGSVTEVIRDRDTAGDLLLRLSQIGAELLRQTIDALAAGVLQPQPQGSEDISYAPKITKSDARIDWTMPAMEIDRRIRATTPAPGAWSQLPTVGAEPVRIGLGPVIPVSTNLLSTGSLAPGEIGVEPTRILVGTLTAPVELTSVTPQGRKTMPATDWIRGLAQTPGVFS
jgi:methionyl-tRNA formyltransferase